MTNNLDMSTKDFCDFVADYFKKSNILYSSNTELETFLSELNFDHYINIMIYSLNIELKNIIDNSNDISTILDKFDLKLSILQKLISLQKQVMKKKLDKKKVDDQLSRNSWLFFSGRASWSKVSNTL